MAVERQVSETRAKLSDATSEIYSRRFGRRETANSVIGAIAIEGFRRTRRVGERDIGVWPEQIDGVARQASRRAPSATAIRELTWGWEPFLDDQEPPGGSPDASPAQNLVRTHLEVVVVPEPMGQVPEDNR
jgi:hypothetical protein